MFASSDLEQLEYRYLLEDIIELQKQFSPICSGTSQPKPWIVGGTLLVARGKINRHKLVPNLAERISRKDFGGRFQRSPGVTEQS